jgi:hypothetical protein
MTVLESLPLRGAIRVTTAGRRVWAEAVEEAFERTLDASEIPKTAMIWQVTGTRLVKTITTRVIVIVSGKVAA